MNVYWKSGIALALVLMGFVGGCSYKQRELNAIKDAYAEQVNEALQANRELEKKMQADADSITQKYQKEQKNAEKTIADLRSRIADGSLRLSVRTESAGGMSDGAGFESGEARADIARGDAERLVSIASRGDEAIRDLNQCIDRYNAVRGSR